MTRSEPETRAGENNWQQTVDSCSHYLVTHGIDYHQAVDYFRRSLLEQAREVTGSAHHGAKLAGVSRTMYYRPGKSLRRRS